MENKKDILLRLLSADTAVRSSALEEIKKDGDLSIVPELLRLAAHEKDNRDIIALLTDIKDEEYKHVLLQHLQNSPSQEMTALLLRICWESSLNFDTSAEYFTGLFLEGSFPVALEAATILEHLHIKDPDVKSKILAQLNQVEDPEKAFLVDGIVDSWENDYCNIE